MATLNNMVSGYFTSDGNAKTLNIPCDCDYMETVNWSQMATTQATGVGVKFEWQLGMADDAGIEYKKSDNTNVLNGVTLSSGGFTRVNTSSYPTLGAKTATTGVSKANPAVVTVVSTAGFSTGDTVRVFGLNNLTQINGLLFRINVINGTTFGLTYMNTNNAAFTAATSGYVQKVIYPPIYYPMNLTITAITAASSAVITLSETHGLTVGQRVVFSVPTSFGMSEMNGLRAQITAIDTSANTVTVNINSSAFTAFAWPTVANFTDQVATMLPFGDAPDTVANIDAKQSVLDGATYNRSLIGMKLAAGIQSPAGSSTDVIYWRAFKSSQTYTT